MIVKRKEKKKGRMYLEMLVKRFLTHPVGVLDRSPLGWDPRPVWLSPAWPPERFPSASGTSRAQILTAEDPRLEEGLMHRTRTKEAGAPPHPGLPFAGQSCVLGWLGLQRENALSGHSPEKPHSSPASPGR